MYAKINSIPYYQVKMRPDINSEAFKLIAPLQMTFELLNGRSYSEPQIFGPYMWFLLHSAVVSLPENLNRRQSRSFTSFIKNFPVMIPCQLCREHAYAYIIKTLPYSNLESKENIFRYLWTFHNFVNSRVANSKISLIQAKNLYGYNFPQRGVVKNLNTGEVTNQPLCSQKGYGPVFCLTLLISATYYPENPTKFIQGMMIKVIQNLDWLIPNSYDKENVLRYLSLQTVNLAVTSRELLFNLFFKLIQYMFLEPPFRSINEAKNQLNFNSFGQGQVITFKY